MDLEIEIKNEPLSEEDREQSPSLASEAEEDIEDSLSLLSGLEEDVGESPIKREIKEEIEKSASSLACRLCNKTFIRSKMLENHEKQRKCQQARKKQKKVPFQVRCAWCWTAFNSHTTLREHIVSDHDGVYPFTCKQCGKGYTVKCYLLYHVNKTHKDNKIQDKSPIKKAKRVHDKSSSHPCQQCDKIYDSSRSLKRHVVVDHLEKKRHCCDICGQSFYTKIQFIYHSNKMHQTEDIECEYCHRKFYLRSNLTKHVDAVHLKTTTYICSQCDKSYPRKCQLKSHINKVHEQHKYYCELCGKSFFLLNRLKKHIEADCSRRVGQTGPEKFCQENCEKIKDPVPHIHCTKCERTFARESSMLVHFKVAHENAMLISCHKCENTTFENRAQYLLHCNKVHNDEEHHCKMCPLKFPDLLSLKKHKLGYHRAEIKCTICDSNFFTPLQLEYHINKVHGKNVYQCENCPKKFFLQTLCKRHNETVHLRIKPFQCEECSETFASKIQRLTHAVKVHNFSKFQCKTCDRKFPGINILRKHVAKKHADVKLS